MKNVLVKVIWPGMAFDQVGWTPWRCEDGETGESVSRLALHKAMREAGHCDPRSLGFDPFTVSVYHHDPEVDAAYPNGNPLRVHLAEYRIRSTRGVEA